MGLKALDGGEFCYGSFQGGDDSIYVKATLYDTKLCMRKTRLQTWSYA